MKNDQRENTMKPRTKQRKIHLFPAISSLFVLALLLLSGSLVFNGSPVEEAAAEGDDLFTIEDKEILNSVIVSLGKPGSVNGSSWERSFLQDKNAVLAEVFTATWCPPCYDADMALEELLDKDEYYSRERFNTLFYHPSPDSRDEDPFGFTQGQERIDQTYGFDSFPSAAFDGSRLEIGAPADIQDRYLAHIQERLSRKRIVDFKGSMSVDGRDVTINVTVKAASDIHPINLRFLTVLVEDHLYFEGSNGITDHRYVVREMLRNDALQLGEESLPFHHEFSVDNNWNMSNASLVFFVQSTDVQFFGGEDIEEGAGDSSTISTTILITVILVGFGIAGTLLLLNYRSAQAFRSEMLADSNKRKESFTHSCDICGKKFTGKDDLKKHTKDEHYTSCPACGVKLKESNLKEHLKKVHKQK